VTNLKAATAPMTIGDVEAEDDDGIILMMNPSDLTLMGW
jgi:hypothetical protein